MLGGEAFDLPVEPLGAVFGEQQQPGHARATLASRTPREPARLVGECLRHGLEPEHELSGAARRTQRRRELRSERQHGNRHGAPHPQTAPGFRQPRPDRLRIRVGLELARQRCDGRRSHDRP